MTHIDQSRIMVQYIDANDGQLKWRLLGQNNKSSSTVGMLLEQKERGHTFINIDPVSWKGHRMTGAQLAQPTALVRLRHPVSVLYHADGYAFISFLWPALEGSTLSPTNGHICVARTRSI